MSRHACYPSCTGQAKESGACTTTSLSFQQRMERTKQKTSSKQFYIYSTNQTINKHCRKFSYMCTSGAMDQSIDPASLCGHCRKFSYMRTSGEMEQSIDPASRILCATCSAYVLMMCTAEYSLTCAFQAQWNNRLTLPQELQVRRVPLTCS